MKYSSPKYKPEPSKATLPIVMITFFIGIIALMPEIDLFRLTFIPLLRLMVIWAVLSALPFLLLIRLFKKHFSAAKSYLLALIYAFGSAGLPLYLFMAMNYYLADAKSTEQTDPVLSANNGNPNNTHDETYIEIEHKGLNKQIFYPRGTPVETYKVIALYISKGYWGFDIINDKTFPPGKGSVTI